MSDQPWLASMSEDEYENFIHAIVNDIQIEANKNDYIIDQTDYEMLCNAKRLPVLKHFKCHVVNDEDYALLQLIKKEKNA
jgi:hypothetical protein